jgi:hypothetical protein
VLESKPAPLEGKGCGTRIRGGVGQLGIALAVAGLPLGGWVRWERKRELGSRTPISELGNSTYTTSQLGP